MYAARRHAGMRGGGEGGSGGTADGALSSTARGHPAAGRGPRHFRGGRKISNLPINGASGSWKLRAANKTAPALTDGTPPRRAIPTRKQRPKSGSTSRTSPRIWGVVAAANPASRRGVSCRTSDYKDLQATKTKKANKTSNKQQAAVNWQYVTVHREKEAIYNGPQGRRRQYIWRSREKEAIYDVTRLLYRAPSH